MLNKTLLGLSFILVLLIGITSSNALAHLRIVGPDNTPYLGTVYIQEVGVFNCNQEINLEQQIENRQKIIGNKINIPSILKVFIPPTSSTVAELFEVPHADSENELVIKLAPRQTKTNVYQRVFYGPKLVNGYGHELTGAKIWFNGYSDEIETVIKGNINPSIAMDNKQDNLSMIIYKPGYDLKIVPIKLSKEALENKQLKIPATNKDIILAPAPYTIITAQVTDYDIKLYKEIETSITYYKNEKKGSYYFVFQVNDKVQNKTFTAYKKITEFQTSFEGEIKLKDKPKPYLGREIDLVDLPITIPRIEVRADLQLLDPQNETDTKPKFNNGKEKVSPVIMFILYGALGFSVIKLASLYYKEWLIKKDIRNTARKLKEVHFIEETLKLCDKGEEDLNIIYEGVLWSENERLDCASQKIVLETVATIKQFLKKIHEQSAMLLQLKKIQDEHDSFREKKLESLKTAMSQTHYDIALSIKEQIKQSEEQNKTLTETIEDMGTIITNFKESVHELISNLKTMNERATLLADQSDGAVDLTGMANNIKSVAIEITSSVNQDTLISLRPGFIVDLKKERHKAQMTGVEINDITALQEFLKERE